MKFFIAMQVVGIIMAATIILIFHWRNRSRICDSCKNLKKKGGDGWKYMCNKGGYSNSGFNRPPTYCSSYCPRDDKR